MIKKNMLISWHQTNIGFEIAFFKEITKTKNADISQNI